MACQTCDFVNGMSSYIECSDFLHFVLFILHTSDILSFSGNFSALWNLVFWYGKIFQDCGYGRMQKQGDIINCSSFRTLLLCKAYPFSPVSRIIQRLTFRALLSSGDRQSRREKAVQVFLNGIG